MRITSVAGGASATIAANSNRVQLRVTGRMTAFNLNANVSIFRPTDGVTFPTMMLNATWVSDSISLEKEGTLVYESFTITCTGTNAIVIETFLDDQQNAPPASAGFPTRDIRQSIPTAMP